MLLIIGLGNPGKKYENTRHNVGFTLLKKIKEKYNFPDFQFNKRFNAEISINECSAIDKRKTKDKTSDKIILVKPQTFINLSGTSIKSIADFYKLTLKNIIVIHDDLDIKIGKYKIAEDSSSAGHNGVQNIIDNLGTQKFRRIRIGIANSDLRYKISPENFVLQKFVLEEIKIIEKVSEEILREIDDLPRP